MSKLFLCCILAANLLTTLVMARPLTSEIRTKALELHGPFIAHPPLSSALNGQESFLVGAPQSAHNQKHRPFDKSIAGGEAILCGLVLAAFASIVCYIRVTRRRKSQNKS